jgi:hypothetical protein
LSVHAVDGSLQDRRKRHLHMPTDDCICPPMTS